ncbi:hypothetical protein BRC91_04180 [Halobacteriales archaeon QS_4_62_28]|nr:MAG: hypothetical protein BRC91_04180 [Halobacteriales archaeon QS_4_62_28]
MVNKAIVGILVLIILTSLGVGVLIGTQLGDSGGIQQDTADGASTGESETTQTATATPTTAATGTPAETTTQTATATPTVTAAPTATATPTPAPAASFDPATIEQEMLTAINEGRADRGLYEFTTSGTTFEQVRQMVRVHSRGMVDEGRASFVIDGNDTEGRYRGAELFRKCAYEDPDGGNLVDPDQNSFQAVGSEDLSAYESEAAVAQAIVDDWFSSSTYKRPLVNRGASRIAVGVTFTENGEMYAAAAICA